MRETANGALNLGVRPGQLSARLPLKGEEAPPIRPEALLPRILLLCSLGPFRRVMQGRKGGAYTQRCKDSPTMKWGWGAASRCWVRSLHHLGLYFNFLPFYNKLQLFYIFTNCLCSLSGATSNFSKSVARNGVTGSVSVS